MGQTAGKGGVSQEVAAPRARLRSAIAAFREDCELSSTMAGMWPQRLCWSGPAARCDHEGASDDTTGGVVSSDAALPGSGVASKPVVLSLASTIGFYNLPEWAGRVATPTWIGTLDGPP